MDIENIMINSKEKMNNALFVCIKGENYDSHDYVDEAIKNGAIMVMSERKLDINVLNIVVKDTKKELCYLSSQFYDFPSLKYKLNGITGTDGKTTTSIILKTLLQKCCYIGTNGLMYNDVKKDLENTTPNSLVLNKIFSELPSDIEYVSMEVSSKAIKDKRVYNFLFDRLIYTNITHEHLDYHDSLDEYINTKISLIDNLKDNGIAIMNIDSKPLLQGINKASNVLTYGINNKADLMAININKTIDYTSFDLVYNDIIYRDYKIPLFGIYNLYNALGAILTTLSYNININEIKNRLNYIPYIKGRMERITYDNINYIIDFAHTPNAIFNVLTELKEIKKGNLICVIGCGGNKDSSKRPMMGYIASYLSDFVIYTSDDPINEDPKQIINQMLKDVKKNNHIEIINRKKAISYAVRISSSNDIIAILGKGLEVYFKDENKLLFHNDYHEVLKNISMLK